LSVSMLAALGADALRRDLRREPRSTREGDAGPGDVFRHAGLSAVLLLAQVTAMAAPLVLGLAAGFVETHKGRTLSWLDAAFVHQRGFDTRWTAEQLYQFVRVAVDLTQPATLRQLALLLASATVLLLWDRARVLGRLWQVLLVLLVAVD